MSKNILHDVMTKEQRSIRHVPMPSGRRRGAEVEEDSILYEREEFELEENDGPSGRSWGRILLWCGISAFVVLLIFALGTSLTGATVTVTQKTQRLSVNTEFTAGKPADAKLRFEAVPVAETVETIIPANTTKTLTERASGTIIVYNAFSDKPQRLIKNTRFENRDGLIYRIGTSVTIPGKAVKDGKTVPGSLEVLVTADSPGTEYNIPLSDFTVPGFKGDAARYAGFYARSKTPMAGGFDGTVKTPSEEALTAARASLQTSLAEKVAKKSGALVPSGHILFTGATLLKNESLPPEEVEVDSAVVRERASGALYLFKREDIVKAIARALLPVGSSLDVEIPDLDKLVFIVKEADTNVSNPNTIKFLLKGEVTLVFLYDAAALRSALAGKEKEELTATLSAFPTIQKADLVLRPFWSGSFPKNVKKIKIEKMTLEAAKGNQ